MLKCLTYEESARWLSSSCVKLSSDVPEAFPGVNKVEMRNVMVFLPQNANQLGYFSVRIVEWLPTESARFLWIWKWHHYPLVREILFETVRRGYGADKDLALCPGHMFEPNRDADFEVEYSSSEHAILSGLILLMMMFDWQGFVLAEGCDDQLIVGDESIFFCSNSLDKIAAAVDLASTYKLKYLLDRAV